ncbi:hypothetical protein D9M69_707220 [compost metagenome]
MLQQPGMLGRRFVRWQGCQVGEDVVLGRDIQRHPDSGKIVHGHGQGAVHVEHPVAQLAQAHAQSLRWRIRPSWHDDATSCPA